MEEEIFLKTLPPYLQKDINNLIKELKKNESTILDCLLDEVYGSINSALYDNEITKEEAEYLRNKYYFNCGNIGDENGKDWFYKLSYFVKLYLWVLTII